MRSFLKAAWSRLVVSLLEDTSTSGAKFAVLDGLRGVAVLTVFFSHSSGFSQRLTPWTNFHGTGQLGVYLFFVLSGFLLAHALLLRTPINFTGFWFRRFFRIAPLYYLVVCAVFACQLAAGKVYNDLGFRNLFIAGGWRGFLEHLVFFKGNSVFWTIAAEFEFYILLPFLIVLLIRFGRRAAWVLAIFAILYCAWAVGIYAGRISPNYALKIARIPHNTQFFDVFIFGILAAWLWRGPRFQNWWDARAASLHLAASAAAALLLGGSLVCVADDFFGVGQLWVGLREWSVLYGLGFAFIILSALNGNRLLQRALAPQWLRIIGVTGFSWYLLHFPVLSFMSRAYGPEDAPWSLIEDARWMTSFAITGTLAVCSYLCVEKPFMLFSRSFLKRRTTAPAAIVPA
jgi:peptidoglycan/LPS O-acetylase OafA/YrhL